MVYLLKIRPLSQFLRGWQGIAKWETIIIELTISAKAKGGYFFADERKSQDFR